MNKHVFSYYDPLSIKYGTPPARAVGVGSVSRAFGKSFCFLLSYFWMKVGVGEKELEEIVWN